MAMIDLLWPPGALHQEPMLLPQDTVIDLGLLELARAISADGGGAELALDVLRNPLRDAAVIDYRRQILFDLFDNPHVCDSLRETVEPMRELTSFARAAGESDSPLLQAIWRLGELELYVECIGRLQRTLRTLHGSSALSTLAAELTERVNSAEFGQLSAELPGMRAALQKRRSVTVGINLDERLRPVEAALLSVNERPFRDNTLMGSLLGRSSEYLSATPLHRSPSAATLNYPPGSKMPLAPLFRDIEKLLRDVTRPLRRGLERYLQANTSLLRSLEPQLRFYIGAVNLMQRLQRSGFEISAPEVAAAEERCLHARGAYNLHLALRAMETSRQPSTTVVANDIQFDRAHRIQVLTGPNHGGKTTYVQATGIVQVLAQAGLFVPAGHARISPADGIWTHFPVRERAGEPTGRFAEELQRLSSIMEQVTPHSLILCNESLSGTGPMEAVGIAEELLRALRQLGVRTLFATHLHDLAARCEQINAAAEADAGANSRTDRVVSLRAEVENDDEHGGRRTYRIRFAPPYGSSYAHDVARRYGLSFQQIMARFRERGIDPRT